ncbi:helix-turn-helix domain-containing protein [Burkholderia stagnalis]|uniref:helix-turn-helix domain-containing protein n=1 Tax=Burkholderia stagnalis TaxID=1503054 RepID=UPI0007C6BDBD|nr:helix-turn-helix domain-containing protein [Burkholderia stagnalis]
MTKKKAAPERAAEAKNFGLQYIDNSAKAQRARVLAFLHEYGSLSTLDARHKIDVMHPAARVMELRERGFRIVTIWSREMTPEGGTHRMARYHLMREVAA